MTEEAQTRTKSGLLQEKYSHLVGRPITISEAAEKYGVPRPAIEGWIYVTNYVHFVDENSYPKTVDEGEVAVCVDIYRERQESGLTGVPFFDEDGAVVEERKHPGLAEKRRRKREESKELRPPPKPENSHK